MAKALEEPNLQDPLDSVTASREERKATGRMVALFVALLLILLVMYHAWIRKTPVLAGVMVPALIMLLYAAGVLFLAKRDKQRRLLQESQLRAAADFSALNEIITTTTAIASTTVSPAMTTVTPQPNKKTTTVASTVIPSKSTPLKNSSVAATKPTNIPSATTKKDKPPLQRQSNLLVADVAAISTSKTDLKNITAHQSKKNNSSNIKSNIKSKQNVKTAKNEKSLPRFREINELIKKREPKCLSRSLSAS